ncbi:MAG: tRNA (adenosine(37)-N6)-dimethylallyltransferase MiaA, partial [Bacilli bacterium]|nr:tRNA (adenosine(37)-N6)-dimethylallyltransferase MiaA [Bacilli bacterium]
MIEDGLLNEVKCLFEKYGDKLKSLQAIGYKELFPVIKNEISLEEGVELVKKNTRNYAKRQMTFIRHQFTTIFYKDTDDLINIIKEINH